MRAGTRIYFKKRSLERGGSGYFLGGFPEADLTCKSAEDKGVHIVDDPTPEKIPGGRPTLSSVFGPLKLFYGPPTTNLGGDRDGIGNSR